MNRSGLSTDEWKRVEKIFHAVADEPAARRPGLLNRLTGSNARLRAEVESLLAHDQPDATVPALTVPKPITGSADRSPGSIVGEFRMLLPLAMSASSEVWCGEPCNPDLPTGALAAKSPDQRVAVKFLRDENARRLARFENEARLLSRCCCRVSVIPTSPGFLPAAETTSRCRTSSRGSSTGCPSISSATNGSSR